MMFVLAALVLGVGARDDPGRRQSWVMATGSTSGIGSALALEAAEQGFSVVLHGRDRDRLVEMKKKVEARGVEAEMVCCDLDGIKSAERLYRDGRRLVEARGGVVDILVANAGIARTGAFVDMSSTSITDILDVNLISTVALCRIFLAEKERDCLKKVLITSSIAGCVDHGIKDAAVYAATKSFLRSFGNALRSEGHQVCVLLPGATESRFAQNSGMQNSLVFTLAPRLAVARPSEVAKKINFHKKNWRRREVVPGFLNCLFVLSCDLTPNCIGRTIANIAFSHKSQEKALHCRGGFFLDPTQSLGAVLGILFTLTISNVVQNNFAPQEFFSSEERKDDTHLSFRTKKACLDAWRAAQPPELDTFKSQQSTTLRGQVLFRGAAAPLSAFITHALFPLPLLWTPWYGKRLFYQEKYPARQLTGQNLFGKTATIELRPFVATIEPSRLDGKEALILQYSGPIWGKLIGMRDEVRQLSPGVLIGLGSMRATGGPQNCAPFLLFLD